MLLRSFAACLTRDSIGYGVCFCPYLLLSCSSVVLSLCEVLAYFSIDSFTQFYDELLIQA